jgi:TolA-binding protein
MNKAISLAVMSVLLPLCRAQAAAQDETQVSAVKTIAPDAAALPGMLPPGGGEQARAAADPQASGQEKAPVAVLSQEEPKPAEAKPAPAAETPVTEAKPAPPAQAPAAAAKAAQPDPELAFFKARAAGDDDDTLESLLPQVEDWVDARPAAPEAAEAQLLKASLRARLGRQKPAMTDLLRYFYEYPGAASSEEARKLFAGLVEKKADKKLKPVLLEFSGAVETGDTAGRLAVMLQKVSAKAGVFLYEPLLGEYRSFFRRFPGYPGTDMLLLSLADLHRAKGEYEKARLSYQKLIAVYPSSPLLARAKLSLADTLADDIGDRAAAVASYQDIAASLPGTDEAWAAYKRLPALAEKIKNFKLAVETYEKIIELYPDKVEAYRAYKDEARVLREELDKPAGAVAVLKRLADKYKGEKAIEALFLAAEIYRKDLKDAAGELGMYDRIAADYPADPQAPKALLEAGKVCEDNKNLEKAREYYSAVTGKYPQDPLAKKAQKRIDGLLAR